MRNKKANLALLRKVMNLDLQKVKERLIKKKVKEVVAEAAIRQFKRFFYLAGTQKGSFVPTGAIREVWHEYLLFTKEYSESCHELFGKFIHHHPINESAELKNAFNFTAEVYRRLFGEDYEDVSLRAYSQGGYLEDCCSRT